MFPNFGQIWISSKKYFIILTTDLTVFLRHFLFKFSCIFVGFHVSHVITFIYTREYSHTLLSISVSLTSCLTSLDYIEQINM